MSDKIFAKSIKVVSEDDDIIGLYGEVMVQPCNKEKTVTILYTIDPWIPNNSVTAKRSPTNLSNKYELYYFEISTFKNHDIPLYLEFRARCDIADSTFWANQSYEYFYDENTPKELFYHDTAIDNFTSRNNSAEENYINLEDERRRLEVERKRLEDERKRHEEERKSRQQEEERRKLSEERRLIEEERRLIEKERRILEKERRQQENGHNKRVKNINKSFAQGNSMSNTKECSTCTKILNIKAFLNITDRCNHDFNICHECAGEYIKRELNKGNIGFLCPVNGCSEVLNENDVKKLASEEIFKRYEQSILKLALSQISTFRWCLNPNCGSGQDHYQGDKAPIMTCNTCGQKSCTMHELLIENECEICEEEFRLKLQEEDIKKECTICTDNIDIKAFLNITYQCNHDISICRECVGEYIKHEIEDNGNVKISCPEDGCNELLNEKDIKEFASEDIFKRYEKFMLNFALSQISTFQWCLNPDCGSGQDHYQGENVPIMTCDSCGHKSCIVHGHPVDLVCEECRQQAEDELRRQEEDEHRQREEEERRRREEEERRQREEEERRQREEEERRRREAEERRRREEEERRRQEEERRRQEEELRRQEETRRREEEQRRLATLQNAENASTSYVGQLKQCPKCASRIEKNGGCDHMTCRRPGCGHQFCWICMVDWSRVVAQNARGHNTNCKYYRN